MAMMSRAAVTAVAMTVGLSLVAPTGRGQASRPANAGLPKTLAVPGASNSTPSLAALGATVAIVWTATKDGTANVYLATSSDEGATFSAPHRVNDKDGDAGATTEQPPRVAITTAGRARTLTVVWSKRDAGPQETRRDTIRVSKSTDGGVTFTPARFIHDPAFSGARGWESLAVAPDGTVHIVWLDGRDADKKIAEAKGAGTVPKGQPPQAIYHGTLSADGRMAESLVASDVCFCCKTAVTVDTQGNVYAAWRHIFPGNMRDIAFAKSAVGDRRWGPFVRVSEDKWELNGCPEDGPSIAADPTGTIHIVWATVVNAGEPQKALFYATSRDGRTFSPRARVPAGAADTPGHPQLVLMPDGEVFMAWDEIVGGVRRVSHTRVSRTGTFRQPQVLSGDEAASYPVIARVGSNDVLAAWTSRAAGAKPSDPAVIRLTRITTN